MTSPEVIEALRRMRSLYNGTYAPALDEAIGIMQGADLSGFFDKLWRLAYERGKEEGKAERGTGKWHQSYDSGSRMYECSACGGRMIADPYDLAVGEKGYGFCPYCGARMEG